MSLPSLFDILWIMWRRKFILIVLALLGGYAGLALARQFPTEYTATGTLLTSSGPVVIDGGAPRMPGDWIISTEIHVLHSRAFADAALGRVGLPPDPGGPGFLDRFFGPGGWLSGAGETLDPARLREAELERVRQGLVVTPGDDSFVLRLEHTSFDAAFSADFLNALMSVYIERKSARAAAAKADLQEVLEARRAQIATQISEIISVYSEALEQPNNTTRIQFIQQRLNGLVRLEKQVILEQERINAMPGNAGVRVVSEAVVPRVPSGSKKIYAVLAAILASVGTATLIFVSRARPASV